VYWGSKAVLRFMLEIWEVGLQKEKNIEAY
jgi:hypothetical protein